MRLPRPTLRRPLLLALVSLLAVTARAEPTERVVIAEPVTVSADRPTVPHVEPRLAVDPLDASHLVATSMVLAEGPGGGCGVFVSFDAGRTWRRGELPFDEKFRGGGDPTVAFDSRGNPYLACLLAVVSPDGGIARAWRSIARPMAGAPGWRRSSSLDAPTIDPSSP